MPTTPTDGHRIAQTRERTTQATSLKGTSRLFQDTFLSQLPPLHLRKLQWRHRRAECLAGGKQPPRWARYAWLIRKAVQDLASG